MNSSNSEPDGDDTALEKRLAMLDDATRALAETREFAKQLKRRRVLDSVRAVLLAIGDH